MAIRTAIVIGGGIAGPATALALRKVGIDAAGYETYPSSAERHGGVVMIAPNGLRTLSILGLEDAVSAVGQPIERMVIADGRGRSVMEFGGVLGLPPSRLMWRSDLYRVIRDAAIAQGIRFEYGKQLLDAD